MNKTILNRLHTRRAVSLAEILTSVVILAVLVSLLFPTVASLRESTKAHVCTSNLRQLGSRLNIHVQDNNGYLDFFTEGANSDPRKWPAKLRSIDGMTTADSYQVFTCPVQRPVFNDYDGDKKLSDWIAYGMRLFGDKGLRYKDDATGNWRYKLNVRAVEQPSDYFIMGDSWDGASIRQSFRFMGYNLQNSAGFHLVHNNAANVLFLDGHVEACNKAKLAVLGLKSAYDSKGQTVPLP